MSTQYNIQYVHCDNYYGEHKVSTDPDLPRLCVSVFRMCMCVVCMCMPVYARVCMWLCMWYMSICIACVYMVSDRSHQGNSLT